ncbi:FtsX-like permease family protein [Tissierella sp.]|uniref:ABC transporter permease n=1 Tax=Tissierella sp. TaxID=41274 RepID=UPI002856F54C|nr:FtsX-like permease family protein [Tissierella sp.]MDR7855552.1 FtsX-like permease family protein [Tissierella sp.]
MRLAFNIATRFLKSSKGQTALIVIGIAIGVSVQIFIGSLIDGLQISLIDKTIGSSSHITIKPNDKEKFFPDNEALIGELKENKDFIAVSKVLDSSGFMFYKEESYPILMRGFEFESANKIYKFQDKLIEGHMPLSSMEVIIGKDLVEDIGINLGESVQFATPDNNILDIKIVGIFDLKSASINKSWLVSNLDSVQAIFQKENLLSSIETQVDDVFDADKIADDLNDDLNMLNLETSNWKAQNEELLSALTGQSASSYMIQVFVLLAVLLGIASVLAISVVQKSKQLGILKAMGIKDNVASKIFLLQGLILGIIGSIIGTGLGLGLTWAFSTFVKNPDGTPLVPFYLDYAFITISIIVAISASTFAAFIPAKKSSKLNPIEVIKNG